MNFLVEESWEINNPVLKAFQSPSEKIYPLVELALNSPVWHVGLWTPSLHGDGDFLRRFMLANIEQTLAFLTAHQACRHQLGFQPAFARQGDVQYPIRPVKQIVEAVDANGGATFLIVCADGERIVLPDEDVAESELTGKRYVYDREDPIWSSALTS